MDLYQRLAVGIGDGGGSSDAGLRTTDTKAIETRDGDMQATLLSVDAP